MCVGGPHVTPPRVAGANKAVMVVYKDRLTHDDEYAHSPRLVVLGKPAASGTEQRHPGRGSAGS